jgi:putative hydrolase of the HAD superfamily
LQIEGDSEELAQLYLKHLGRKDYLLPHAIEVLEYLYRRALLVLLTNGITRVQKERITRSGIEIFFKDIIISEEIGLTKPDPAIFLLAAKRINLAPSALLCVGDSPSSDIRGGFNAGMDTCWFRSTSADYPRQEPEPDYIIDDLRELIKFAPDFC